MKKKTIVYIGGFELPDKNAAAHRVISNGILLSELNFDVRYIGVNKEQDEQIIKNDDNTVWNRKYPKTKKEWTHYQYSASDILNILKNIPNLEMVICYNLQSIPMYKIMKYCKKRGVKVVSDCTEWYSVKSMSLIGKILKGSDSFFRMRILNKKCDGIICISKFLQDYYKESINILLPPLIDNTENKWKKTEKKTDENIIKFTFAGTLGRNKDDLKTIVDLMIKLNEKVTLKLIVLGIGSKEFMNKYGYLPNDKLVSFEGRKNHEETLSQLKETDFSIFLREDNRSNRAGFPTKFVESYTLGIPIITNLKDDLDYYLENGRNGFFLESTFSEEKLIEFVKKIKVEKYILNNQVEEFHYKKFKNEMANFLEKII